MSKTKFSNLEDYLEKVSEEPDLYAFVPISLAAQAIGVNRSTLNDLVRARTLKKIVIRGDDLKWQGIQVASLKGYMEKIEEKQAVYEGYTSAAREVLIETAKSKGLIAYGELMSKIGLNSNVPNDRTIIGRVLGDISSESWKKSKFMLSVLAVLKSTEMPNSVFFDLAEELDDTFSFDDEDDWDDFFEKQRRKIYRFYSGSRKR